VADARAREILAMPADACPAATVAELAERYWDHVQDYYRRGGEQTGEVGQQRLVLRLLRDEWGDTLAVDFGPRRLKALRDVMVRRGWGRDTVNGRISRVVRCFRWAVEEEMIVAETHAKLAAVTPLRKGRTRAPEGTPVCPVDDRDVEAVLPFLPPVVADMVRIQALTGCRPSEVCILRKGDVDRTGDVWEYRPESHKTEHQGRERVIYIGPQAQEILRPYLLRSAAAYCFSPAETVKKQNEAKRAARKSPVQPSQRDRRKANPKRRPGPRYTRDTYRRAVQRAAARAGVPRWSPNQLRHAAGTRIRREFGLEAAQVVLGHASADVTEVYAERDRQLALDAMRRIG
jgi:integrase